MKTSQFNFETTYAQMSLNELSFSEKRLIQGGGEFAEDIGYAFGYTVGYFLAYAPEKIGQAAAVLRFFL